MNQEFEVFVDSFEGDHGRQGSLFRNFKKLKDIGEGETRETLSTASSRASFFVL
jgi:hypothetical protein